MASGTLIAVPEALLTIVDRRGQYRCRCGHVLRVFGSGRHRVYFELADVRLDDPADVRLDDPVMDRVCPACGRGLPGKNRR